MEYISNLVSVIIPTYHRCDLLRRSIESVLGQTYREIECIVVNDNTPGDEYSCKLYELIAQYRTDDRVIFLEQKEHINGAEARNCGIRNARGEFVAFLDDDDWWKADKIEKQVNFIRTQGNACGGVSTLVEFWNENQVVRRSKPYRDGKICKEILRREVDVTTCSILLKHVCLDDAGYFDNKLKRHQEIQLLSFFTDKYELKLLDEYLTCVSFDDQVNNPTSDNLVKIKDAFFNSVQPIMCKFSKGEQKRIRKLHMFELAYVYYKERRYYQSIMNVIKIAIDPITAVVAFKRVIGRKKEWTKNRNNI